MSGAKRSNFFLTGLSIFLLTFGYFAKLQIQLLPSFVQKLKVKILTKSKEKTSFLLKQNNRKRRY